jgi:phosphomannomutase
MDKAREWVAWDPNPQTRAEIQALIDQRDEQQLSKLLAQRLKFGTAGLRGQMGAGYARMNDLVVLQTAQVDACFL